MGERARARRELAELVPDPSVVALVQGVVDEVNERHSRYEQIKQFALLPRDFSADEGEVTPTLKLRRRVAREHFADEIEAYSRPLARRGETATGAAR